MCRSLALKRLSPNTSDTETRGVASSFEAGLYQRCNSKVKSRYIYIYRDDHKLTLCL